jgi:hypothetical protein
MSKDDKREQQPEAEVTEATTQPTNQETISADEGLERMREAILKAGTIECGILELSVPITARGEDVTELRYDFRKITGRQYIQALDVAAPSRAMNAITNEQALELFIAATKNQNDGIDDVDIRERMGIDDVIQAVRIGKVFFGWKALVGDKRTRKM